MVLERLEGKVFYSLRIISSILQIQRLSRRQLNWRWSFALISQQSLKLLPQHLQQHAQEWWWAPGVDLSCGSHLIFIPLPAGDRRVICPYGPHSANKHTATTHGTGISWTCILISLHWRERNPCSFYELFSAAERATPYAITARYFFFIE